MRVIYAIVPAFAALALLLFAGCGGQEPPTEDWSAADEDEAARPLEEQTETPSPRITVRTEEDEAPAPPVTPAEEAAPEVPADEDLPEVIARIGDATITREEFLEEKHRALESIASRSRAMGIEDTVDDLNASQQQMLLNGMITQKIFEVLAESSGVEITPEMIELRLDEVKQTIPEGREWDEFLAELDLTEDVIRARVVQRMTEEEFLRSQDPDMAVTEEEVQTRYDQIKEAGQAQQPETVEASHVLVQVDSAVADEAAWDAARDDIEEARRRVAEGEDFGAVASEVSDCPSGAQGGSLGSFTPGRMVPEFDEVAFSLPVGEVSEPFRTQFGWHIVKVIDKQEARELTLDDVREGLKESMEAQEMAQARQAALAKAREELDIEVMVPALTPPGWRQSADQVPGAAVQPGAGVTMD